MKKTLAILGAFLALAACSKKDMEPAVLPEEQDIVVNITISRTDVFEEDPGTRATVKSTWDDGDVVFVFFSRIAPPKYLEMKYQAGTWKAPRRTDLRHRTCPALPISAWRPFSCPMAVMPT